MNTRKESFRLFLLFLYIALYLSLNTATAKEPSSVAIALRADEATVLIGTVLKSTGDSEPEFGSGSGFFVSSNLIATNYHVIKGALMIGYKHVGQENVHFIKSVRFQDTNHDLAVLEVQQTRVNPLYLGDSDKVKKGETIYVTGAPGGVEGMISVGTITGQHIEPLNPFKYIQKGVKLIPYDALTAPGSSGSPVLNGSGDVIGVHVGINPLSSTENLKLAIPSKHLERLLKKNGVKLPRKPPERDANEEERLRKQRLKAQIVKQLKAATVHLIRSDSNGHELPLMSGFFVSSDKIATDFHVVDGSRLNGVRSLKKGKVYADLLLAEQPPKTDKKHHLAILNIEKTDVEPLSLGNSDDVVIGGDMYMVGDPATGEVSQGKISDILVKDGVRYFELDAQVSPGSSGGPIVNTKGEVIAVTALKVPDFSGTLKYAIPVIYLKGLLKGPGDPPPSEPKVTFEPGNPPSPEPKTPPQHDDILQQEISFYKNAQFREAVEALQSALNWLDDPIERARAHLFLGFSKRGLAESKSSVHAEFREALRYNPSIKLPPEVGMNHPVFKPLLDQAREKSIGTLTITASPPETEIQIYGGAAQPKLPDDRTVPLRLFKGNYAVEGKLGDTAKVVQVQIEPGRHKEQHLQMQQLPPRVSPSHEFELTLDIFSTEKPKKVVVHYTMYDTSGNQLGPEEKKEMQWQEHKPESSIWVYHVKLPSSDQGGRIVYRIEADGKVIRDEPIQVQILEPPNSAFFEVQDTIPVKARVVSAAAIRDVRVYYDAPGKLSKNSPAKLLKRESDSNTYTGEVPVERNRTDGDTWFFVAAAPRQGHQSRSATRAVRAKPPEPDTLIITLEPVRDPMPINKPINITAEVKSGSSLQEVRVYYDFPRKQLTESSPSTILEDKKPGTYVGRIPKERTREAGYIWYFVSATTANEEKFRSEDRVVEVKDSHTWMHQGVWASHSWSNLISDDGFYSGWERGNVMSLAFLQEGKGFQTLGVQLDYTYDNPDYISAMVQWGPSTRENPVAFAFLAGITGYRSSDPSFSRVRQSRQFTPLLGGSVKFYPHDRVVVDATASVKLQSENGAADRESSFTQDFLHHYEAGIRLYISPTLNLRAGYGRWRLGEYDNASVQVGLGATF